MAVGIVSAEALAIVVIGCRDRMATPLSAFCVTATLS